MVRGSRAAYVGARVGVGSSPDVRCVVSWVSCHLSPQRWDRLPYIYNFVKSKTGNPDGASCPPCAV